MCTSCDVRFLLPSHLRAHIESRHADERRTSGVNVADHNGAQRLTSDCDALTAKRLSFNTVQPRNDSRNSLEQIGDHDYYRCAVPIEDKPCTEIFECLECSSFFVSFDSLRAHTYAEHRNEDPRRRNSQLALWSRRFCGTASLRFWGWWPPWDCSKLWTNKVPNKVFSWTQ